MQTIQAGGYNAHFADFAVEDIGALRYWTWIHAGELPQRIYYMATNSARPADALDRVSGTTSGGAISLATTQAFSTMYFVPVELSSTRNVIDVGRITVLTKA